MKRPILIIFVVFSVLSNIVLGEISTTHFIKSGDENEPSFDTIVQEIINTSQYMTYTLYTKSLGNNPINLTYDNWSTAKRNLMFNKEFKFVTHGWQTNSPSCTFIRDAYLEARDINVILMDWSRIANDTSFIRPLKLALFVGKAYGSFINFMVVNGVDLNLIHLIGHSMGGIVSAVAARSIESGSVARFTELDPAAPGIWADSALNVIVGLGAQFVDVIYSAQAFLDIVKDHAVRVHFFPNGGNFPQPGCSTNISCSHGRSYVYFAESINVRHRFVSRRCKSWSKYKLNECEDVETLMGDPVNVNATGKFYLRTNEEYPYAQG